VPSHALHFTHTVRRLWVAHQAFRVRQRRSNPSYHARAQSGSVGTPRRGASGAARKQSARGALDRKAHRQTRGRFRRSLPPPSATSCAPARGQLGSAARRCARIASTPSLFRPGWACGRSCTWRRARGRAGRPPRASGPARRHSAPARRAPRTAVACTKVRTEPALADGMAGRTSGVEQVLPLASWRDRDRLRIGPHRLPSPPAEEIAHHRGQELRVFHGRVPHPTRRFASFPTIKAGWCPSRVHRVGGRTTSPASCSPAGRPRPFRSGTSQPGPT